MAVDGWFAFKQLILWYVTFHFNKFLNIVKKILGRKDGH